MKNRTEYYLYQVTFNQREVELAEWLKNQPNKGAYIKELISADKARKEAGKAEAWDDTFALVQAFQEEHGRLPTPKEEYNGVRVGRWLETRLQRDKNRPDRMEKLQRLNILSKWEQHYQQLIAFIGEHGRLPKKDEKPNGFGLGNWLYKQKKRLHSTEDPLTPAQKELLAQLPVDSWQIKFLLTQEFRQEYERFPKQTEVYRGVKIGRWLYEQRRLLSSETNEEKIAKLKQIGAWEPSKPSRKQS